MASTRPSARLGAWDAVTIAVLAWLCLFPLTSVDVYYHLAVGRKILETGEIPRRGVFSVPFGDRPWHDNEWGFQLLAAAVADWERDEAGVWVITAGGRWRLVGLRVLALAATLALLAATLARRGVRPPLRSLIVALAAFLTFGNLFWAVRPQIFTYLGVAAVLYLLERERGGARWPVVALPLAIALWANLHGAFLVGVALIGAEAVGESLRRLAGHRADWPAGLWLATLAAPAAALLNPHGIAQLTHPFIYLAAPEIHAGNFEWERPRLERLPLLLASVLSLTGGWLASRRARPGDLIRVAGIGLLFLSGLRHLPLLALVIAPPLAQLAERALARLPRRPALRQALFALILVSVVFWSGAFTRSSARFVRLVPDVSERPVRPLPEAALRRIVADGQGGAILNAYRFGGFLMFRLYPEERLMLDGRNDLYREWRHDPYNRVLSTAPGWEAAWADLASRHGVRYILLDEVEPLVAALRGDPGWRVLYRGEDGIVALVRNVER